MLHLNQWTTGRDVAFPEGVWAEAAAEMEVPAGTKVVVAFVAARARDTVAVVASTFDGHVFPIRIWESGERVDPNDVAEELRAVWSRDTVHDLLVSEHDWSWVMLELADEGLPIVKVPRSPQRLALQWQAFFDAVLERRLTHEDDPVLARHVSNLGLIPGPSGPRPDLDVGEGAPIASALAAMIAYDGMTRVEVKPSPKIHVWQGRSEG